MADDMGAYNSYLEMQLFGGTLDQTAPDLFTANQQPVDTGSALSDSSMMGGLNYSFYTDPAASMAAVANVPQYSAPPTDLLNDFAGQLPPVDLTAFEPDQGYASPDGSISTE